MARRILAMLPDHLSFQLINRLRGTGNLNSLGGITSTKSLIGSGGSGLDNLVHSDSLRQTSTDQQGVAENCLVFTINYDWQLQSLSIH